jgi:uncharacterized repeat protein (TIGR01451 family)
LAGSIGLAQAAKPSSPLKQQSLNMSITKDNGQTVAVPGQQTTYTIVVSNTGLDDLIGATLTDTFPPEITGVSWTCTGTGTCGSSGSDNINDTVNLPAGTSVTYIAVATVSSGATGSLVNTARITLPDSSSVSATDTDTLTPQADLSISKTNGQNTVIPGSTISYTITVSNPGPSDANEAVVSDTFPAAFNGVTWSCSGSGGATCPGGGSGNINHPVNLPAGRSVTFTATATVNPAATGSLVNTATVTPPGGVTDPGLNPNSDTDSDTLTPQADLAISKTNGQTQTVPGTSTTYTVVVTNTGPSVITDATVTDNFSDKFSIVSWTCTGSSGGTCSASGSGNINDTVTLPVGATVTYLATGSVSAGSTGSLVNTATVTPPGGVTDPGPNPNSASDTDTLALQADLSISKNNGQTITIPGTSTTYTIVASNNGPSSVDNAIVADPFPSMNGITWTCSAAGGATCPASGSGPLNQTVDLPVNGSVTFVATGTVNRGATGSLVNTATIIPPGGVSDPGPNPNSATDTDTLTPQANLGITKTNGQSSEIPGTSTTYTIVVTNSGPSNVTGATVADIFPLMSGVAWSCTDTGNASCPAGGSGNLNATVNVPVGDSVTFNAIGTIDPSARGSLINTATVTVPANVTETSPGNNSAPDTDTLNPQANLNVAISDTPGTVAAGNNLTYNVTVTNNGPSDATNVTLVNNLPVSPPPAVVFVSATPGQGNCGEAGGVVTCDLLTIPAQSSVNVTIVVTVPSSRLAGQTLTDTADVDCDEGATDSDTEFTSVKVETDLAISKTESADPSPLGMPLTYTLRITNNGPSDATGVSVSDNMPNGVPVQSATPSQGSPCTGTDPINCTLGNMIRGATATVTIVVNPSSTGSLNNSATVSSATTDPTGGNNSSGTISTSINRVTDLAISMTASPDPVTVGNNLTYNITVTNNGPSAATTVTMTHTLPPTGITFQLVTPGGPTCNLVGVQVICTLTSMAKGSSIPIAVVVKPNDGTTGYISSSASVTATSSTGPDTATVTVFVGDLKKVYLPVLQKPAPTELFIDNDTGGPVTFTVVGVVGASCNVPAGHQNFRCGSSFPPGTYTVQVTSICGNGSAIKTYDSGPQTTRVFCN